MTRSSEWMQSQLAELSRIAGSHGGRILSSQYLGAQVKHAFQDRQGREFLKSPCDIRRGEWSPYESNCVRDPSWHLARARGIAVERGGKLLSSIYLGAHTRLEFEDRDANRFWLTPASLRRGAWSPYESGRVRDPGYHMDILAEIAASRGGRLVSTTYVNTETALEFEDAAGNRFWAQPQHIKQGRWSAHEGSIGEALCRQVFEASLSCPMPGVWGVVRRPSGQSLQLDGFNPVVELDGRSVSVAFEYQGRQHSQPIRGEGDHQDILQRDREKRAACAAHLPQAILLIEVDEYMGPKWDATAFGQHVLDAMAPVFSSAGLCPPRLPHGFALDLARVNRAVRALDEVSRIALERGGRLLSTVWAGNKSPLEFMDKECNRFHRSPEQVKQGAWPGHAGARRGRVDMHVHLHAIAAQHGGRFLPEEHATAPENHVFEDSLGRRFERRSDHLARGLWSPWESGRVRDPQYRMEQLGIMAAERGGCLLSTEWQGVLAQYRFMDVSGNQFVRRATDVQSGNWSPHETHSTGARRRRDAGGRVSIQTADGDRILYVPLGNGRLGIRSHVGPQGLERTWSLDANSGLPMLVDAPGGDGADLVVGAPRP